MGGGGLRGSGGGPHGSGGGLHGSGGGLCGGSFVVHHHRLLGGGSGGGDGGSGRDGGRLQGGEQREGWQSSQRLCLGAARDGSGSSGFGVAGTGSGSVVLRVDLASGLGVSYARCSFELTDAFLCLPCWALVGGDRVVAVENFGKFSTFFPFSKFFTLKTIFFPQKTSLYVRGQ